MDDQSNPNELLQKLNEELVHMKKGDPQEYLAFIRSLNQQIEEIIALLTPGD